MSAFDNAGLTRLLNQYSESPKLKSFFEAILDIPAGELRDALETLFTRLSIDESSGVQLDKIGEIVGQPRPPIDVTEGVFAFLDGTNDPDKGFSAIRAQDIGGQFSGLNPVTIMADPEYRFLLKAIIFNNNAGRTLIDIERYSELLLGAPATIVNGVGAIDIEIPVRLSRQQKQIIADTLNASAGVRIRSLTFSLADRPFGFAGANNTGFGAVGVPQEGAGFVGLFTP